MKIQKNWLKEISNSDLEFYDDWFNGFFRFITKNLDQHASMFHNKIIAFYSYEKLKKINKKM